MKGEETVADKRDFLGNVINMNDEVVFMQTGYRNFMRGIVVKMTDKTLQIEHQHPGISSAHMTTTKQFYDQVVKVIK